MNQQDTRDTKIELSADAGEERFGREADSDGGRSPGRWTQMKAILGRSSALICVICGFVLVVLLSVLAARVVQHRHVDLARLSDEALAAQVRARPGDARAADALGERYVNTGRAREAAAVLAAAAVRAPENATLQNHLGVAQAMLGDRTAARAAFDRAVALAPDGVTARENRARLALEEGDFPAALAQTREVARLSPRDPERQRRLGDLLAQISDFGGAADAYGAWARLQPGSFEAQLALGQASARAERYQEAGAALRAAQALRPLPPEDEVLLGLSLAESPAGPADTTEAERLLRAAVAEGRGGPEAPYGMGLLAARAGRWDEAVVWFRAAVKADPARERPRYRLARALLKAGRQTEAARELAAYDRLFRRSQQRRARALARSLGHRNP
jgi:tetratricopeptide (TPR) repeat protein